MKTLITRIAMALAAFALVMVALTILLAIGSAYALADTITPPPPDTSVSFAGVITTGTFTSPTIYVFSGTNTFERNWCSANCTDFEVQSGVVTGRSTFNYAEIYGFTDTTGASGGMFGHLGRVSFDAQTDMLSGVFTGKEQMAMLVGGKWSPEYWWTVQGTFSENIGSGIGSVSLSKETFIGLTPVPEPSQIVLLATGLFGIGIGVVRRKLRV